MFVVVKALKIVYARFRNFEGHRSARELQRAGFERAIQVSGFGDTQEIPMT